MTPKEQLIAKEQLTAAKALIADPGHWCQGTYARGLGGRQVSIAEESEACSWCALGALWKVINPEDWEEVENVSCQSTPAHKLLHAAALKLAPEGYSTSLGSPVPYINDRMTHADVMTMFDKAIESA
jgi:hypothetical protein